MQATVNPTTEFNEKVREFDQGKTRQREELILDAGKKLLASIRVTTGDYTEIVLHELEVAQERGFHHPPKQAGNVIAQFSLAEVEESGASPLLSFVHHVTLAGRAVLEVWNLEKDSRRQKLARPTTLSDNELR